MRSFIARSVKVVQQLEEVLLISALVSMLTMALVQIFLRNFFDTGILWAESFLRIVVLWVGVLGAMVATRQNNHITVDAISRYLSTTARRITSTIANLFAAVICIVVAWESFKLARIEYQDHTIGFGAVPMWVCQSILPAGFGIMGMRFMINAARAAAARQEA